MCVLMGVSRVVLLVRVRGVMTSGVRCLVEAEHGGGRLHPRFCYLALNMKGSRRRSKDNHTLERWKMQLEIIVTYEHGDRASTSRVKREPTKKHAAQEDAGTAHQPTTSTLNWTG
jgi:hypothetical protein